MGQATRMWVQLAAAVLLLVAALAPATARAPASAHVPGALRGRPDAAGAAPPPERRLLAPGGAAQRPKCFRGSSYSKALAACACRPGKGSWVAPGAAPRPGRLPAAPPGGGCDGAAPNNRSDPELSKCRCRACPAGTASAGGLVRNAGCFKRRVRGAVCPSAPQLPRLPSNGSAAGGGTWWSLTTSAPSQSWADACAANAACVEDATGNFRSAAGECANNVPAKGQPQSPCRFCAAFEDTDLIANADAWAGLDWAGVAPKLGLGAAWAGAHISALQMAKIWMVATAKYAGDPAVPSEPARSAGGAASCAAALAVALQEGGNNCPQDATWPYRDANPYNIYDPSWNLQLLCAEGDFCRSGGPWQVSSAWIPNPWRCVACNTSHADCLYLKNPICAARITFEYAKLLVTPEGEDTTSCSELHSQGRLHDCTAAQLAAPSPPGCSSGPFCLSGSGWTSPPRDQMFRQAVACKALPFCRLAIKACALARAQLLVAYASLPPPRAASVEAAYAAIKAAPADNPTIESICPANPQPSAGSTCPP
ncbi:MAG: hypothetical protein J3K34DRAFT_525042 [Monoraphidium minutum]|nr:MAG: hypothetical protein J3K34DRAFT_525042 [Monoraphidium minutum]